MEKSMTFTVRLKPTDEKSKRVIEGLSNLDSNVWPTRNAYIIEALDAYGNSNGNRGVSNEKSVSEDIRKAVREELQDFFTKLLGEMFLSGRTPESTVNTKPDLLETEVKEEITQSVNDEFINDLAGVLDRWNED